MGSRVFRGESNNDIALFTDSSGKEFVKEKLRKLYGEQLTSQNLEEFAQVLSNKELLKKVYLHTNFTVGKAVTEKDNRIGVTN
ncbi:GlmM [Acrasis kona]|uniref:GlmM n=1 Tax=Acrasis kona TaxID=1008807 RepID=A0AAW2ZEM7_9EUKA